LWYDAGPLPSPTAPPLPADSLGALAAAPLRPGVLPPADSAAIDAQLARLNALARPFDAREALRIIGYDTRNLAAAIQAFKRHFIQQNVDALLTDADNRILYNLYQKYL
jgi:N-acetylmuramoyl-L-alanine amidase